MALPKGAGNRQVLCPYCQQRTVLVSGFVIYGRRDLENKNFWQCLPCRAWVGSDPQGRPCGTPANEEGRKARQRAHEAFDPLWTETDQHPDFEDREEPPFGSQGAAYNWLARKLNLGRGDAHIGKFDVAKCNEVIALCAPVLSRINAENGRRRAAETRAKNKAAKDAKEAALPSKVAELARLLGES